MKDKKAKKNRKYRQLGPGAAPANQVVLHNKKSRQLIFMKISVHNCLVSTWLYNCLVYNRLYKCPVINRLSAAANSTSRKLIVTYGGTECAQLEPLSDKQEKSPVYENVSIQSEETLHA